MMYNNVKVPGGRFFEPGIEEVQVLPRDQWLPDEPLPFDDYDPEYAALDAIWQEEHDAWEDRRAADKADEERARQDAAACYGEDGTFDWDEYQRLCDMAAYWD